MIIIFTLKYRGPPYYVWKFHVILQDIFSESIGA